VQRIMSKADVGGGGRKIDGRRDGGGGISWGFDGVGSG